MSGNGVKIDGQANVYLGDPRFSLVVVGPGTGGGCITDGPFKDYVVHMGPGSLIIPGNITIMAPNPLAYNPRCLRRSLTQELNTKYANASTILNLMSRQTIRDFQDTLQGRPGSGDPGAHGAGHYTFGGDPGRDFYASAGDPVFFLHHGMVDRVWWMWQMMDRENRTLGNNAIAETDTINNEPPSPNTTFSDVIQFDYAAGPPLPIRDLMSTTDGPFCYTYE